MRHATAMSRRLAQVTLAVALSVILLGFPTTRANAVVGGVSALGNTAVVRLINGNSLCSGALWTSRIVITAAHCVVTTDGTVTTGPISVYFPGVDTLQSPQTITQSAIITVDGWKKQGDESKPDDIAFLVLSTEMPGASISRLATTNEMTEWARARRVVTLLGYGRTSSSGSSSNIPNAIDQPLSLSKPWPGAFGATQTSTTGICSGDSGGPVVTRVGNELVLIGVNSAASGPCSASTQPSMIGFLPSSYPDLVRRALGLANTNFVPVVTTGTAIGISTTSAVLNATAVGNNLLTAVSFTYGLQPDLSGATVTVDAGQVTGTTPTALEIAVVNLVPGSRYYFRANATNLAGTVTGAIAPFDTLGGLPTATTGASTFVSSDTAVLTGVVKANAVATLALFQYSRLPDFSTLDGTVVAGDVAGAETATLATNLAGLAAGVTYYWRLVATNAVGTSVGDTQSFATAVFATKTSRATNALINIMIIDLSEVTKVIVAPVAKSRAQCTVNSKTKRLTFARPGTCRVKITIIRAGDTTTGVYNLVVK